MASVQQNVQAFPAESLDFQMQTVKDLYSELFLLLLTSVEEKPAGAAGASADGAIDKLMETIDGSMRNFLASVRAARSEQTMPKALEGEVSQFESQLKEGLELMHGRMQTKMAAMARERDDLKGKLKLVQRKRGGTRGYRQGLVISVGSLDDPMQANA